MNVKYQTHRLDIKTGDVILFHKTGLIAKAISWVDGNAYYTHCGIGKWIDKTLFIVDTDPGLTTSSSGLEIRRMSTEMESTKDFCILRKSSTPLELNTAMAILIKAIDKYKAYGWRGIIARLLLLKGKIKMYPGTLPVCSDICADFLKALGATCYDKCNLVSPQDLFRYRCPDIEVLFNETI
jgi:hypothetical protein